MGKFESDKTYTPKGLGYTNKIGAARKLANKKYPGQPSMASDYTKQIMDDMSFKEIELELGVRMKAKGGAIRKFASGGAAKRGYGKVIK